MNMDIVVLAGGYSHEREVSMSSGSLIANALMENGHRVILLDLYFGTDQATTFEEAHSK
ncbi:MAG: D-alanine--D-alanine ligase, partial [Alkalibacterium sp.]